MRILKVILAVGLLLSSACGSDKSDYQITVGKSLSTGTININKTTWASLNPFTTTCAFNKNAHITGIVRTGNVAVATTANAHNYVNGEHPQISGVSDNTYNDISGNLTITATTSTTFTYSQTGADGSAGAGNVAVNPSANDCGTGGVSVCVEDATTGFGDSDSLRCDTAIQGTGISGNGQWLNAIECTTGSSCANSTVNNIPFSAPAMYLRYYFKVNQSLLDCMGAGGINQFKITLNRLDSGGFGWLQPLDQQQPTGASLSMVADDGSAVTNGIATMTAGNWIGLAFKMTRSGGNGIIAMWIDTANNPASPNWQPVSGFNTYSSAGLGTDSTANHMDLRLGFPTVQTFSGCTASNSTGSIWIDNVLIMSSYTGTSAQ